jgi:hypothetical protein
MKTLILSTLALIATTVVASPIDTTTAKVAAANYLEDIAGKKSAQLSLAYREATPNGDTSVYYVFNIAEGQGWIIVSATDVVVPVLGYSIAGEFQTEDQPPAFNYWMNGYRDQILYVLRNELDTDTGVAEEWTRCLTTMSKNVHKSIQSVSPLLSTTWSQGQYYNAWVPGGCSTGCVATAMAQIMKYWNYPVTGTSDHCYNHSVYGQICGNFGATTYNWSGMPNNVTSSNTAVATLMYHCGVAVEMNYCMSGNASGAWVLTNDPYGYHAYSSQHAYPTYFGYSPSTIAGKIRNNFTDSYWINSILIPELDAGRPIQYLGEDPGDGVHSWVCDGYNSSNYFHMNWGWGGSYDGYFSINNLNANGYLFSSNQHALVGIQPNRADLTPVIQSLSTPSVQAGSSLVAYCAESNWGPVYAGSNVISVHLSANSILTPGANGDIWIGDINISGVSAFGCTNAMSTTVQIPAGTTAGTYYVFFSADGGQVITEYNELNNYATALLTVTSGTGGAPVNDNPCNATSLNVFGSCNFVQGTNVNATNSSVANATCDGNSNGDIWYSCVVPASGELLIETDEGTINDMGMAIYTGSCSNPVYNSCWANGSIYSQWMPSAQLYSLNPGTTIWIRLWEFNNNSFGTFYICISDPANTSSDDIYISSQDLDLYSVTAGDAIVASCDQNYDGTSTSTLYPMVGYYLSTDNSLSADDIYLGEDESSIDANDTYDSESESLVIPAGTNSGLYYILFVADYTNLVSETNENNNVSYVQLTITGNSVNYAITALVDPVNSGYTNGTGYYASGQSCTVTAYENSGYTFASWKENGVVVSYDASYSFTVSGTRTLWAMFTQNSVNYSISTIANPVSGGITMGSGIYQSGQSCNVAAFAYSGYLFNSWSSNGVTVSTNPSYTFTVTDNVTLQANFISTSGVEESDLSEIAIYPNPALDEITIEFSENCLGKTEVFFYNVDGALVKYCEISKDITIFDISEFAKGLYLIRIENSEMRTIKKFVKK